MVADQKLIFYPRKSAVKISGLLSCGRRALGLAGADSAPTDPKTTTAWTFTDVAIHA